MRLRRVVAALAVGAVALGVAAFALAGGSGVTFKHLEGNLTGYEEVPSVSSVASAEFTAELNDAETEITYSLSYRDLEAPPTQSHIHFGQRAVNGGISVFLCANPPIVPPPGTQACPPAPATITGTLTAASVIGPTGQGIAAAEWEELLRAIDAGKTYANLHSTKFPGGEVRAQLNESGDPHD
jgi:hypothetical protein